MPTYFLTGANRGIGLEFVRQLSANPANNIIAAVRSLNGDLDELKEIAKQNNKVHIIECDVASAGSISGLESRVPEILSKTGENLNYLFNVAGINATSWDTSLSIDPESLRIQMNVHVVGPAKIVETLQKHLAPEAVVLNMTSGLGSLAVSKDTPKCCTYSISKAALNMLTLHQSRDLRVNDVIVICVDPGWVKTRLGGAGAMIEPKVSIEGMLQTVRNLKKEDSGKFYKYDGTEVPW